MDAVAGFIWLELPELPHPVETSSVSTIRRLANPQSILLERIVPATERQLTRPGRKLLSAQRKQVVNR
jgi:hypothetical protein